MIPTIGIVISAYVILRCLELMGRPATHFAAPGWGAVCRIAAALLVILAAMSCYDLLVSGSRMSGLP
jgi:hypothetical protein